MIDVCQLRQANLYICICKSKTFAFTTVTAMIVDFTCSGAYLHLSSDLVGFTQVYQKVITQSAIKDITYRITFCYQW